MGIINKDMGRFLVLDVDRSSSATEHTENRRRSLRYSPLADSPTISNRIRRFSRKSGFFTAARFRMTGHEKIIFGGKTCEKENYFVCSFFLFSCVSD